MDPNANLENQLRLACIIVDGSAGPYTTVKLVELVLALDEWIRKGGFLPSAWKPTEPIRYTKEPDRW